MTPELALVLALLAAAIAMFAIGRPRMDVVGVLVIAALPLTGILTVGEAFAGFADPNVILIAALFVVGEGLARTGVTYKLGDWLARRAGASTARLVVLLMLSVALLGSIMSSTGVVAIFIPVAISIASRTGIPRRQLLMPLSVAGLISGMMTLIATSPNLVVDAELARSGAGRLGFFTFTPIGLTVLALAIGYMLFARRMLGSATAVDGDAARRTFDVLADDYRVDGRTHRHRVRGRSPLIGARLSELNLGGGRRAGALIVERTRLLRKTVLTMADNATIQKGDVIVGDVELPPDDVVTLRLEVLESEGRFFDSYSRLVGLAEVLIAPDSTANGKSVKRLRFRRHHDLVVIGVRHHGRVVEGDFSATRLASGDTLLVSGPWEAIAKLRRESRDYLVLDLPVEGDEAAPAANQAPFALLAIVVMIVLMVTGIVPNVLAALIAALLMGVFRCIDMPSAYRAIHWPTLLLIVGMMPFALALQRTGGVDLIVDGLLSVLGGAGPRVLLAGVFVMTAVIGLFVSNTATAVLMAPIAISLAAQAGVSPLPFAMTVALAASAAFLTPVSSPVNTLVVEPGRYSFLDFARVGAPLSIVVLIVTVVLVPLLLPF